MGYGYQKWEKRGDYCHFFNGKKRLLESRSKSGDEVDTSADQHPDGAWATRRGGHLLEGETHRGEGLPRRENLLKEKWEK